jgi:hypothetical protein
MPSPTRSSRFLVLVSIQDTMRFIRTYLSPLRRTNRRESPNKRASTGGMRRVAAKVWVTPTQRRMGAWDKQMVLIESFCYRSMCMDFTGIYAIIAEWGWAGRRVFSRKDTVVRSQGGPASEVKQRRRKKSERRLAASKERTKVEG